MAKERNKPSRKKSEPERTPSRNTARARRASGVATKKGTEVLPEFQPPPNDNLSSAFDRLGLVPPQYRGTDQFIDIVTWNIRFFHDRDRDRVKRIVNVLSELNADIIVLQEILEGSLDVVAQELQHIEAGYYQTAYGTTGGNQRVAIMYDLDWIRAKDDIRELFEKGQHKVSGKEVFPRLPLYSSFTALTQEDPFDFQLLGLHLKSQRGGGEDQRREAANILSNWLISEAPNVDADVIMLGDWNAPPSAEAWDPIRHLEGSGQLKFSSINNESAISHLMFHNKKDIGSRLDLTAVTMTASERMGKPPEPVRWAPLEEFLGTDPKAVQIKEFLSQIRESVSDHMPVVTRFYFTDAEDDE